MNRGQPCRAKNPRLHLRYRELAEVHQPLISTELAFLIGSNDVHSQKALVDSSQRESKPSVQLEIGALRRDAPLTAFVSHKDRAACIRSLGAGEGFAHQSPSTIYSILDEQGLISHMRSKSRCSHDESHTRNDPNTCLWL